MGLLGDPPPPTPWMPGRGRRKELGLQRGEVRRGAAPGWGVLGCPGRGDKRHRPPARVGLPRFVALGVTIYLRPLISVREAVRHGRVPREHHFLRTALSAHLVCAQPELPLINCALPPRAAFDAGLAERSPGHTGNIPGKKIAPGHPRCPAECCDQPTLTRRCPG